MFRTRIVGIEGVGAGGHGPCLCPVKTDQIEDVETGGEADCAGEGGDQLDATNRTGVLDYASDRCGEGEAESVGVETTRGQC